MPQTGTKLSELNGTHPLPNVAQHPVEIAEHLAGLFEQTAVERDKRGGTAKEERDLLRESTLLNLRIPKSYGGHGADWVDTLKIVRRFARVDSSLAQIFAFQHLMIATVELFGNETQRDFYLSETVRNHWFWGNTLNPLDTSTRAMPTGEGGLILNGRKGFSTGSVDSDVLIVSALLDGRLIVAAIPSDRAGIRIKGDWDNMGQRQTDSGTVEFYNVEIYENEILKSPGPLGSIRAGLRPCIAQTIFSNIYLGIAEGALAEAKDYTSTQTRPWLASGLERPQDDPYILANYGNMWLELQGAKLLTNQANESLQRAWDEGEALTENLRGRCALDIAAAKVSTTRAGLDVTSRMFEVMGSRATAASARLDRYWRNIRTYTLHDPVDYKIRELGDWALNGQIPKPTFYS
jgi:alkylation response protein AidB-like acyl-CoA dehydrogenase